MLELKNVRKVYKTKSGEVAALNGVSLTFPSSGLIFISGKSGCGKTTLLNVIGGLDGIDSGEICLLGKSFDSFTTDDYDDYRNTFIGFIFQEYNLLSEFSVEKNIEIAMELQGRHCDKEELNKLLKDMEIEDLKNRKPTELSGGQRQRVAIARALVKEPRIIMADEPTGALDSNTGIQVLDILKKLSKDKLVIVVSHDEEFAEKYADRIVHLVDGVVDKDITFSENAMSANVREGEETLLVRAGSDLSDEEKNVVAKAVKNSKKIELINNLSYREERVTEQDKIEKTTDSVVLQKSKMKLKSSVMLGLKSLAVKPLRLVFTILLSAIAFAVFGLFDTVANFNTEGVINNLLKNSESTVALYGEYILNADADDTYDVKFSQEKLDDFSRETGFKVKGIYDFEDNTSGYVKNNYYVSEIYSYDLRVGKNFYTNQFNGFIEFSDEEIRGNKIGNFGYTLVEGVYPTLRYEGSPKQVVKESLYEIAISTYMADSIMNYLGENLLNEKQIVEQADLIGQTITIDNQKYVIVGLVDCGAFPAKYGVLKDKVSSSKTLRTLIDDFSAYVNSGAYKCIFAADGALKEINAAQNKADVFFSGNCSWSISSQNSIRSKQANRYVYASRDYAKDNIIMFDTARSEYKLADDEVLIHPVNLEILFEEEIGALKDDDRREVYSLIKDLYKGTYDRDARVTKVETLLSVFLNKNSEQRVKTLSLTKTSKETYEKVAKDVKVVGIYVGLDVDGSTPGGSYRFMMNDKLLETFQIYTEQGEYSRFIFDPSSSLMSTRGFVDYMLKDSGLALVWFGNNALNTIDENEAIIRQGADLFLYIALALAAFSVFMLFNYIATSIVNKRPTIGVLRGLGSRGRDVLRMFLAESFIIALINGILASVIAAVGCIFVNNYILNVMNIAIPFALFGIRQILIIFGMSILTAVVSSALPIVKISKEKPVSLIRRT